MCMMCNGSDAGDVLRKVLDLVEDVGWALVPVDDGRGGGWAYTVGLASRGHPELVMAGVDLDAALVTLDALAAAVVGGLSLDTCASTPDPTCGDDQCELGLVDVHQSHIDQHLVVIAQLCQAALDPDALPLLRVRQVMLPESHFCRCHRSAQPRLDRPGANLGGGSNRGERRRRRRPGARP